MDKKKKELEALGIAAPLTAARLVALSASPMPVAVLDLSLASTPDEMPAGAPCAADDATAMVAGDPTFASIDDDKQDANKLASIDDDEQDSIKPTQVADV